MHFHDTRTPISWTSACADEGDGPLQRVDSSDRALRFRLSERGALAALVSLRGLLILAVLVAARRRALGGVESREY